MHRRRRRPGVKLLAALTVGLLAVGTAWFLGRAAIRSFFYPSPRAMPPLVEQSAEELLQRLEHVLRERAPAVAESLQPGLTDERITEIESAAGFRLPEDLRSVYRWHNG